MKTVKAQFHVSGGVHPKYNKHLARDRAIETVPLPELLTVSMSQHLGAPAKPIVAKGDEVKKGQIIGEPAGFISAAVHAPTSGVVKAVEPAPTAIGRFAPAVVIEPDGQDTIHESVKNRGDWKQMDGKALIEMVADAGVAGMGGAGFPTHVKLSPPPGKKIDTLIVNGAECEPYLTADYRLMLERAGEIRSGVEVMAKILQPERIKIAVEDNKPEAIAELEKAFQGMDGDVEIVALKTEYPQGAEKQQIFAIIGKEVPSGGLPMDVGALVENVGTVTAIWKAVSEGMPLIERITAVTGTPLGRPSNVVSRIGTPYSALIDFCGGITGKAAKVISGGPMMGFAQPSLDVTVTKTTSGLLLLSPSEAPMYESTACISCGRCVDACPTYLMPNELSQFLEAEDYEMAEEYNVMDCIECGCCAFECPAHRPLVQHMRVGKAEVGAILRARREQEEKEKAEKK